MKDQESHLLDALGYAPVFSVLGEEELAAFCRRCRKLRRGAGTMLFGPTERADRFYVVMSGRVKIYKLSARGDEQILHLYGPGKTFGEAAMWAGVNYPAWAQTLTDCELLCVPRDAIREAIRRDADLGMAMMAGLSAKLREFNILIEELSLKEVPARLAGVLLRESERSGATAFRLKQTKRQLASQIGTVAETLSRALAKLKAAGIVEVEGSRVTILDADALERIAENG